MVEDFKRDVNLTMFLISESIFILVRVFNQDVELLFFETICHNVVLITVFAL
jgi:hypothetical protein